jgi:uncharacterized protein
MLDVGALQTVPNAGLPSGFRKRTPSGDERLSGAGIMFVTPDGKALFVKRAPSAVDQPGTWAFPAGRVEQDEEPADAARREALEEIGHLASWDLAPIHRETFDGVDFATFGQPVPDAFDPVLNDEHNEHVWAPLTDPPKPLHPGVAKMLAQFFREEAEEPEHEESGAARGLEKKLEAEDAGGMAVDRDHDGPWMSCVENGGRRVYINRNVPRETYIDGIWVDVDDLLIHHEEPEYLELEKLMAEFKSKEGREPTDAERKTIYTKAHASKGVPGEKAYAESIGLDWRKWNAWCRGIESKIEKGPFTNEPTDADVKPMKHRHGELEATDSALVLALDRESVRSFDSDGRMRVAVANISKANICPYRGEEIPMWEELGLDPDKVYQMLRDPEELRKAASTFNGVQLLRKHVPVDAEDHRKVDIIGTTGTDAEFVDPYLRNSLIIWSQEGIDLIESGEQQELSCGYHYTPDMTSGIFDGKPFDGVMRNIEGNHVALVEEGRAGPDVVVGDSAIDLHPKEQDPMKPTRLEAIAVRLTARAVNPLLAFDAKVEYGPIFKGLTTKNFKARKPIIIDELKKLVKGKTLAGDAEIGMGHVAKMLDHIEHVAEPKSLDESVSGSQHRAMEAAAHGHSTLGIPKNVGEEFSHADKGAKFADALPAFLKEKGMSEDDIKHVMDMYGDEMPDNALDEDDDDDGKAEKAADETQVEKNDDDQKEAEDEESEAEDESEEEEAEKKAKDKKAKDSKTAKDKHAKDRKGAMDTKHVTEDAMNKAIQSAVASVKKTAAEAAEAREFVRPWVGDLPLALDSADKVMRAAAVALKIEDAEEIHPSALKTIIKMQPRPGTQHAPSGLTFDHMAADSADDEDDGGFAKRFPNAVKIKAA